MKDYDNVIGYDIINEPWAGAVNRRPWLIYTGDRVNLQKLHSLVH